MKNADPLDLVFKPRLNPLFLINSLAASLGTSTNVAPSSVFFSENSSET